MRRAVRTGCLAASLALVVFTGQSAHGQAVYGTGFEAPTFVVGPLSGQDGWTGSGDIQSAVAHAGAQAMHLAYSVSGTENQIKALQDPIAGRIVTVRASFMRIGPSQSFTGLEVVGDNGALASLVRFHDFYGFADYNILSQHAAFLPDAVWHQFEIQLDFTTGMVKGSIDGNALDMLPINTPGTCTAITALRFYDNAWGSENVYIDDVSVTNDSPVPAEASTWGRLKSLYH